MRLFLIKTILTVCAYLPLPLIHGLGVLIGWGLILVPNRSCHDAAVNIGLCFPELSRRQQHQLLRKCLIETGKTAIETSALWIRPGHRALKLIRKIDATGLVEAATLHGRGVILATPHLGAWEAAGLYCAAHYNMTCLYRPLRIPELEDLVHNARSRMGANYVPTTPSGIRALYRELGQGGAVAMLPDQEPHAGNGTFAPFFGIPAYTMVFLTRLIKKSRAPVVFVWCERLSWGRGYHLHFRPAPEDLYSDDAVTATVAMNRAVEGLIRECPAQYQWGYRRFKTRPEGEAPIY
jgi:KDO2-lipid IV(A) lauroyltransferase